MKALSDFLEQENVRKITAAFMAAVLVVGLCVPSTGFAADEEAQDATAPQVTESDSSADQGFVVADGEDKQSDGAEFNDPAAVTDQNLASESEEGQLSAQSDDEWAGVEDTFTVEAIQQFIPDPGFAQGVYESISSAIQNDEYHIDKESIRDSDSYNDKWPEPLTVEEILDEGAEGEDLVRALLANYVGPISASRKGITDITGFQYLKNTTSVDLQNNLITNLSTFTDCVIIGSYNFNGNPISKWPKSFANTVGAATHSIPVMFQVSTAPLAYCFGDSTTPTLTYNVYYPDEDGNLSVNSDWYSMGWSSTSAYGDQVPALPQANGTTSLTLPTCSFEGSSIIQIGLTGNKKIEDYDNWQDSTGTSITYSSGMGVEETGGTIQSVNPGYRFGIQSQCYATLNIESSTEVTGGFSFSKTSEASGKPVAGAQYTLYENDGATVAGGPYTTNNEGVIEAGGFKPGTYVLKETKAADGYTINTDPITITISNPGATTSVAGGVASFERDVAKPDLKAVWGTRTATTGVWDKTTPTTHETAETLNADALLTNKGNVGYKTLSSLTAAFNGSADAYEGSDTIVVKMGDKEYGTYISDDAALNAINDLVKAKKLTGDITIEYKGTYAEKAGHYTATAVQTDAALPVNLSFSATKTFDGTLSGTQGAFGNFEFTATGTGENGATLNNPVYNDTNGKVNFGELSFTKPGTYEFVFAETQGTDPDTQYTLATHKAKVMVTEGTGGLSAQVVVDGTVVGTYTGTGTNTADVTGAISAKPTDIVVGSFENHLKKPTATLSSSKTVDLGSLADGQFSFSLVPGADCKDVTYLDATQTEHALPAGGWTALTNKADGTIDFDAAFSALAFPRAEGTYHFTLTENDTPAGSAYNKDATSVPITVTVTKNVNSGKYEAAVSYDGAATAPTFKNTFKRASLTASKIVAAGGSATDDFEFKLTFEAGISGLTLPADGIAGITLGAGNTATITKVNGVAASTIGAEDPISSVTYTVKGGQQLVLDGVPVGLRYTLQETTHDHYYDNDIKSDTVVEGGSSVGFSNQVKTGDVYVGKAVRGLHASTDDLFTFTMNLDITTGYSWTNRTYNISEDGGLTWGSDVAVAVDANELSFSLKDGWMVRVNKLPVGTYTTVEVANDTYLASPKKYEIKLDANSVDSGAKIDFTNIKLPPTPAAVSLAATKTVDGGVPQTVTTGYANGAYTTAPFAGAFSFTLSQVGALPTGAAAPFGTPQTVTNDANGAVTFAEIGTLTAEGDYTFQVTETTTDTAYVDVDGSTYKAVVHVAYNDKADSGNKDYKGNLVTTANSLYVDKITWTKDGAAATSAAFDNKTIKPMPIKANLAVTKTLDGAAPAAGAFSFTVSAKDGAPLPANTTTSNLADGSVSFGDIEFSIPGTYTYTIAENAVADETVVKDPRTYDAVVTVTDDGTNTLSASVAYTASAATDLAGSASATDKAAFVNMTKANLSIPVTKTITYDSGVSTVANMPIFTYTLTGKDGAPMPAAGATCTTTGAGNASFGSIAFDATGTYTYTVKETAPTPVPSGWTYDSTSYDVTVTVTAANGKLTATPTYSVDDEEANSVAFSNAYVPAPTQATASPAVSKAVEGPVAGDPKLFGFTIAADDTNPSVGLLGMTAAAQASTATAANFGNATFDKAGTYTFTITEDDIDATDLPGYAKDAATYTWSVVVADNGGQLAVTSAALTKDGTPVTAVLFTNTYTTTPTPAQASPDISKTLTGAWAGATSVPSFNFSLAAGASNPANGCTGLAAQATIAATDFTNGEASLTKAFGDATFSKTGTYSFTIAEEAGVTAGWEYDKATYTWTVVVEDMDSQLNVKSATLTKDGEAATTASFTNNYTTTPGAYTPQVNKTIAGGTPAVDEEFVFTLVGKDGAPMPASATAKVTGVGTASFGEITYTKAGTYRYQVSEVAGTNNRYTYDTSVFDLTVTVTDNNSVLETSAAATKVGDTAALDAIVFANSYNDEPGKPEVEKIGKTTKANAGDELSWDIVVKNVEDFDIYGVWVKDVAPEHTTLSAAEGDGQGKIVTDGTTQYATWFIPVLKAGQTATVTLKATVNADVPDGTVVSNVAHFQITGDTEEPEDTTPTPDEPTNQVDTPTTNPKVPAASGGVPTPTPGAAGTPNAKVASTALNTSAKTGDGLPVVPFTAVLLAGGIAALTARRRLKA